MHMSIPCSAHSLTLENLFLTSEFSYLFLSNPTHKTKTGIANRGETNLQGHILSTGELYWGDYEKTFFVEYSLQCVMLRKVCLLFVSTSTYYLNCVRGGDLPPSFLREAEETKYWRERNLHGLSTARKRSIIRSWKLPLFGVIHGEDLWIVLRLVVIMLCKLQKQWTSSQSPKNSK
jgi:hypothetical protein